MKNINRLSYFIILIFFLNGCGGYKPIFSSDQTVNFVVSGYKTDGNAALGKQIYKKINNLSKTKKLLDTVKTDKNLRKIYLAINISSSKKSTSKDSAGKILEYKMTLVSNIVVVDYDTDEEILDHHFGASSTYKVQDRYFDTLKLEKKAEDNLINKLYQELLIEISDNITK